MPQPVAIVIVSWNSAAVIEPCLSSVLGEDPAEVVVVDNGSADDTLDRVRSIAPSAKIVPLADNSGFAAGCNRGAQESESPFVLFLNDDAELTPGYLRVLVSRLQEDQRAASAIGKLVNNLNGSRYIDSAGIELKRYAMRPDDRGHGEVDNGQYDAACEIFGPTGAAALYRRAALEQVGPDYFDEDLFAYYEDVDLAWRLHHHGWRHLYDPEAVALHSRRGPRKAFAGRAFVNRYLVWLKNESAWKFARYAPVAVPWEAARLVRRLLFEREALSELKQIWELGGRMWLKRNGHSERDPEQ